MDTLTSHKSENTLDPTFGDEGKVLFNLPGITTLGSSVLQTDGKILSVARAREHLVLVRHLYNGNVDSLFGDQGIKHIVLVPGQHIIQSSITLQPDGKALISGSIGHPDAPVHKAYLIRVLPEGDLDPSFGEGGRIIFEQQSGEENANCLTTQSDRKIVFVSTIRYGFDDYQVNIRRLRENGEPDSSFGSNGGVNAGRVYLSSILTLAFGRLLFAGAKNDQAMFTRYLENGELDTYFGDAGVAIIPVKGGLERRSQESYNKQMENLSPQVTSALTPSLGLWSLESTQMESWTFRFTGGYLTRKGSTAKPFTLQ